MTRGQCSVMTVDIGNWISPILAGDEEIAKVIGQFTIIIYRLQGVSRERVRYQVFNWLTRQPATIHEDASSSPLEQNPIASVVSKFNYLAVSKRGLNQKLSGRIVTGVVHWIAILELYRMLN